MSNIFAIVIGNMEKMIQLWFKELTREKLNKPDSYIVIH